MSLKRNLKNTLLFSTLLFSLSNCTQEAPKEVSETKEDNLTLAKKPTSWINERVEKAEARLNGTEAGKIVWQAMEAHGGLNKWFQNGPISFRFDYMPVSGGSAKKSIQQIDTWSNKAVHQSIEDKDDTFGWDGTNAWYKRNDTAEFGYDLRFWALTPYYFEGQPFIFDGQGVKLEKLTDKEIEGQAYNIVKVSFDAGTGDAPDDYYINYYDKNTHLLKAIKYIVSYPKFFKDGNHSPEKLMILTSYLEEGGIKLAKTFETYSTDENGDKGELKTKVEVSAVKFMPELENSYFETPSDAKLITE